MQTIDADKNDNTLVNMYFSGAPQINSHTAIVVVCFAEHSLEKRVEFFFRFFFVFFFFLNIVRTDCCILSLVVGLTL